MERVSEFPYLTTPEFRDGCQALLKYLPDNSVLLPGEQSVLRITKRPTTDSPPPRIDTSSDECGDEEIIEIDEEVAVVHRPPEALVTVLYDVLLSPSYRVPVIYITIKPPLSVAQAFELMVPAPFRAAMRETGVMGALSMTDHPSTGMPAFLVHPCRTADAMCATVSDGISVVDYMFVWLGIVGASVGLSVPSSNLGRP